MIYYNLEISVFTLASVGIPLLKPVSSFQGQKSFFFYHPGTPLKHIFPSRNLVLRFRRALESSLLPVYLLNLYLLSQDVPIFYTSSMKLSSFFQARPYLLSISLQRDRLKFSKVSPTSLEEIHSYDTICGMFCRSMWRGLEFQALMFD